MTTRATRPGALEAEIPQERRLMKFDPTVNTGTLLQIAVILGSMALAYGTYREDQTRQDGRIAHVEAMAATDRDATKETLREIKQRMENLERSNQDIKESLAVLWGRATDGGVKR